MIGSPGHSQRKRRFIHAIVGYPNYLAEIYA